MWYVPASSAHVKFRSVASNQSRLNEHLREDIWIRESHRGILTRGNGACRHVMAYLYPCPSSSPHLAAKPRLVCWEPTQGHPRADTPTSLSFPKGRAFTIICKTHGCLTSCQI